MQLTVATNVLQTSQLNATTTARAAESERTQN